jgi:hypothetical protein
MNGGFPTNTVGLQPASKVSLGCRFYQLRSTPGGLVLTAEAGRGELLIEELLEIVVCSISIMVFDTHLQRRRDPAENLRPDAISAPHANDR